MRKKIVLLIIFFMLITPNVYAVDPVKIGVVDFQEFMKSSVAGQAVQEKIRQTGEEVKTELNRAQVNIRETQKKYKDEASLWDKKQKEEKQKQFQNMLIDFQKLKGKKEKDFNEFRFKLINEMQADILEYADKLAKEKGYLLIIEKQSGRVLYSDSTLDITTALVRDHDRQQRNRK